MITVKECAELFGVKEITIYKWIERGILKSVKIGGSIRINREVALHLLEFKKK